MNTLFLIAYFFGFVATTIVLIIVDVVVGFFMLEGDWIICWVFVFKNESGWLGFRGVVDKDSFVIVSFALIEGKYCRIDFVVCIFLMDVLFLLLFVVTILHRSFISLSCLVETGSSVELVNFYFLILFCEVVKVLSGFFGWV